MKQLKLDTVRTKLPFDTQVIAMHYLSKMVEGRHNIEFDFDVYLKTKGKNLQRPLCWTLDQKKELILSVLKGIKIPNVAIIIDDYSWQSGKHSFDEKKFYRVIDGKQRLTTLISFYKGEFPVTYEGVDYYYSELDEWAQREISMMTPLMEVAYEYSPDGYPISDDAKIAWFERINFAGTPQDIEHLNNLKS